MTHALKHMTLTHSIGSGVASLQHESTLQPHLHHVTPGNSALDGSADQGSAVQNSDTQGSMVCGSAAQASDAPSLPEQGAAIPGKATQAATDIDADFLGQLFRCPIPQVCSFLKTI